MAKNEIPKISDFQFLGLCDGFAKVTKVIYLLIVIAMGQLVVRKPQC